jgi:hypothetical protein
MKTTKANAKAQVQWLVDDLHPTLRKVREGWGTRPGAWGAFGRDDDAE